MQKMSNQEYQKYVSQKSPKSPLGRDLVSAFFFGGLICTVGQVFMLLLEKQGLSEEMTGSAVSVIMIFLGALLTGLCVYDDIAKVAGAGTVVPITGFANSIVAPAMEFKSEGFVLGMAAKMFTIAGPVLVFGISASALYGLIAWLIQKF